MAYYTHAADGTRTVEAKGDIADVIVNISIDETPILARLKRRKVKDNKPQVPKDSLSSVDTSNYHAEDAAAPAASDTARSLVYNYAQVFMKTAEVTDSQNAVAQYGMGKELLYQEAKKMKEFALDIECSIVSDQARQEATPANGYVPKQNGMTTIIATTGTAVASFAQAQYGTDLATVVTAGGHPRDAYMDSTRKIAVAAWTTNVTRYSNAIKELEEEVLVYHSALGEKVRMHWHHKLPQSFSSNGAEFLLLDFNYWELCEFLPMMRKSLPDTGAGPSTLFKTQLCVLCSAEQANLKFY